MYSDNSDDEWLLKNNTNMRSDGGDDGGDTDSQDAVKMKRTRMHTEVSMMRKHMNASITAW